MKLRCAGQKKSANFMSSIVESFVHLSR